MIKSFEVKNSKKGGCECMYSKEIAGVLKNYLDSISYDYDFCEKSGVFSFRARSGGGIKSIFFKIEVKKNSYKILASPKNIRIENDGVCTKAEYKNKKGGLQRTSHFEMDKGDKTVICIQDVKCGKVIPDSKFIGEGFADIFYFISEHFAA